MDYDHFHDVVKNSKFLNLNKMGLEPKRNEASLSKG